MEFNEIRTLIFEDLNRTTALIRQHLHSEVALIEEIGNYIINGGGKRARAVLALLSGKICKLQPEQASLFAAIIEMIHAATLLHDDVIDASTLRRGNPTANEVYGNSASVLSGDFLYSRTFEMMVILNNMQVLQALARASNRLAEGEVLQLQNCHKSDLSEQAYLEVIERKTATLFAVAAEIPAILAGAPPPIQAALYQFGRLTGIAFQLLDDIIDYTSNETTMGKNQGDDLMEGKMTLPLIYAKSFGTERDRLLIDNAILQGDTSKFPQILKIIQSTASIDKVLAKANAFIAEAKEALTALPQSEYTQALQAFADLAISRST